MKGECRIRGRFAAGPIEEAASRQQPSFRRSVQGTSNLVTDGARWSAFRLTQLRGR